MNAPRDQAEDQAPLTMAVPMVVEDVVDHETQVAVELAYSQEERTEVSVVVGDVDHETLEPRFEETVQQISYESSVWHNSWE